MHCCLPRVPPWSIRYRDQTYSVCSIGTMIPMEARKLETGPLWSWLWIQKSVCFCLWFQSNGNKGEHHHTQIKTYIFKSLKIIEVHKASSPLLRFGGYPLRFFHPNLAPSLNLCLIEYCPCYFISHCPTIFSNSIFHLSCNIRGSQAASSCILHFGQLFFLSQASSALTSITCMNPCVPVPLVATFTHYFTYRLLSPTQLHKGPVSSFLDSKGTIVP